LSEEILNWYAIVFIELEFKLVVESGVRVERYVLLAEVEFINDESEISKYEGDIYLELDDFKSILE
jgi:hypothetical protein